MTTIEEIHNEFDGAVETLLEISNERQRIAESLEVPKEEKEHLDGLFLKEMGFGKSVLAKKVEEFNSVTSDLKNQKRKGVEISNSINDLVSRYQDIFPHHKFILYSQVIKICEKYNLYLAPAGYYKGDIPSKNIEEMKNFPYDRATDEKLIPSLSEDKPVCEQIFDNSGSFGYGGVKNYICAPLNEFDMSGNTQVEREIYGKSRRDNVKMGEFKMIKRPKPMPKDPIILLPVKAKELNELGFIVVTKWGLEASDPGLIVGANN